MQKYQEIIHWLKRPKHPYQKEINRFPLIPATVIFLTLLALITFSWRSTVESVKEDRRNKVATYETVVENSLKQRLAAYEDVLYGASSLVSTNQPYPAKHSWETYINSLDLRARYPSIYTIGFAPVIQKSAVGDFTAVAASLEVPGFAPSPLTDDAQVVSPLYSTNFNNSNGRTSAGRGINLMSDATRKMAIESAIASGKATLTAPLTFIREDRRTAPPSAIMYLPVYKTGAPTRTPEERKAAVSGVSFIAFRLQALLGMAGEQSDPNFGYTASAIGGGSTNGILGAGPRTEIYRSSSLAAANNTLRYEYTRDVQLNGQKWSLTYYASDQVVPRVLRARPRGVIIGGFIFSLSVATSVYLLIRRRILDRAYLEDKRLQTVKDDMLSLASHQLRTPATGVKQYIGMLLQGYVGKVSAEQKKMLAHAYDSNERQLRIINDFLYMAKADAGRIVISSRPFDFTTLIKEVMKEQKPDAKQAGITLQQKLKPKVVIMGDPHSVRMVVENLISNAIKYTRAGGKVEARLHTTKGEAVLSVEDTGVGIDKKDFHLLFKQFSRIPNELTQRTSGSGVGLYLAQHLAKLNKGHITVKSTLGKGSTFVATFKLKSVRFSTIKNAAARR